MGKIFCLMGKSSSGKDTIFKRLLEDKSLCLKAVIPYTTRPKRVNETEGVEYHFIDENILCEYKKMGKIIELREYDTVQGKWFYCTIDDGQIDLYSQSFYILIVTLEAYKNLSNYFGKDNVIPIYIEVEDSIRLERALKREKEQLVADYNEMCRRFLADNMDFDTHKLKSCGIQSFYENYDLNKCIDNVRTDIDKYLGK